MDIYLEEVSRSAESTDDVDDILDWVFGSEDCEQNVSIEESDINSEFSDSEY